MAFTRLAFALSLAAAATAAAQDYPSQPIRLIVPGPPGVGIDLDARPIAQKMAELLRQPMVIENRPAAGPERDFAPVSLMQVLPSVLTVHPSLGVSSVRELIALAKARPGEITFASQGNGTFVHMAGEFFKAATGVDLRHIPYGAQSPFNDLAGGHVMAMFSGIAPVIGNAKAGKLKILAVSSKQRVDLIAGVPTFIEAGVPAYDVSAWNGLVAPRGTPATVVARLNAEAAKAVQAPEVKERMLRFGGVPVGSTPEEFAEFLRAERSKWGKLIREARLQLD